MRMRLSALALLAALVLLVACGGATPEPPPGDAGPGGEETQEAEPTDEAVPTETPTPTEMVVAEAATETPAPTDTPEPSLTPTESPEDIDCIVSVESTGATFTGTGALQVVVRNDTDETIICVIPAGYVFEPPPDVEEQRLMALQSVSTELDPGEQDVLDPFVACIDADKSAPSAGVPFTPTGVTDDQYLSALAACLDEQELPAEDSMADPFASMGLQFAVWNMSDGSPLDIESMLNQELEGEDGALTDMVPAEELEQFTELFAQLFGGGQEWLDLCGIEPRTSEDE